MASTTRNPEATLRVGKKTIHSTPLTRAKMMLFARWVAMCYADTHLDNNGKSEADYGFNFASAISVLNREDGKWWKTQLEHFEKEVYPNYRKMGTLRRYNNFLKRKK